jgi:thymidylate synthase (FAD)
MNIVTPYAKLMDVPTREIGIKLLQKIEWCGRISHRSEEAQTPESWDRFIRAVVLGHGDWSIVEHVSATVDFLVDRGITHELVRHRLFSFTQESTRFVNYEKKMPASFIKPEFSQPQIDAGVTICWEVAVGSAEDAYRRMIAANVAPQIARSVFPNALASRIIITGNLRNWRHFLLMRTTKEAHPQMREVTIPLLAEFKERIPILFEDIEPLAKQSDAIRSGR